MRSENLTRRERFETLKHLKHFFRQYGDTKIELNSINRYRTKTRRLSPSSHRKPSTSSNPHTKICIPFMHFAFMAFIHILQFATLWLQLHSRTRMEQRVLAWTSSTVRWSLWSWVPPRSRAAMASFNHAWLPKSSSKASGGSSAYLLASASFNYFRFPQRPTFGSTTKLLFRDVFEVRCGR